MPRIDGSSFRGWRPFVACPGMSSRSQAPRLLPALSARACGLPRGSRRAGAARRVAGGADVEDAVEGRLRRLAASQHLDDHADVAGLRHGHCAVGRAAGGVRKVTCVVVPSGLKAVSRNSTSGRGRTPIRGQRGGCGPRSSWSHGTSPDGSNTTRQPVAGCVRAGRGWTRRGRSGGRDVRVGGTSAIGSRASRALRISVFPAARSMSSRRTR